MSKRRRIFSCMGACGRSGCAYVSTDAAHFKSHVEGKKKIACEVCGRRMQQNHMLRHMRNKHVEALPPSKRVKKCRVRYNSEVPSICLDDAHGWKFVFHKVQSHVSGDLAKLSKWSEEDQQTVLQQKRCRHLLRDISVLVYKKWRDMQSSGDMDNAGGRVPGGRLLLRRHALFQLSLDRKKNHRPHFPNNGIGNLNFVALGMNHRANLVSKWGDKTCHNLRLLVRLSERLAPSQKTRQLQVWSVQRTCWWYKLYRSAYGAFYKDTKCREAFQTFDRLLVYSESLLRTQRGHCAVSGIYMLSTPPASASQQQKRCCATFQPSLDAVDPVKGHVPGNLRWVCWCLNSCNVAKRNGSTQDDDTPTAWTPSLFQHYVGLQQIYT